MRSPSDKQDKKAMYGSATCFLLLCGCSFALLCFDHHLFELVGISTTTLTGAVETRSIPLTNGTFHKHHDIIPSNDTTQNITTHQITDTAVLSTPLPVAISEASDFTAQQSTTSTTAIHNYTDLEFKFYQRHYDMLHRIAQHDYMMWGFDKMDGLFASVTRYKVKDSDLAYHLEQQQAVTDHDSPILGNRGNNRIVHFHAKHESLCQAALLFNQYRDQPNAKPWPHVLLFGFQQDLGGLGSMIHGETTATARDVSLVWKRMGCKKSFILQYLNHPDTLAAITSQFHYKWDHPKTHSIPLGIMDATVVEAAYKVTRKLPPPTTLSSATREREMLLSFSLKKDSRARAQKQLDYNFRDSNISTAQTWAKNRDKKKKTSKIEFFQLLSQSKFILSPHGLGLDCYRTWEGLWMGVIPILESLGDKRMPDGWFRTLDDLPALVVESYAQVTPELLEQTYHEILEKWDTYNWEKLTKTWWVNWIHHFLEPVDG
ncbi:expressed unknown protein [Seminavis robusta]|uniref:RXYLT1 C-terminal domain-containing protein n=1 Tax=Seminavis robusta TaxID=568900 RepID=A0A9N8ETB8_9STRA|nr:expressed unknown protein [Seminavis robusta]|eukprot:Sro1891_g303820.1 n/a (487) ;mRNA; f:16409-17869